MPKYSIQVIAEVEIEAPSSAKAYELAHQKVKIIGEHVGSRRDKHDRDFWKTSLKVNSVVCRKPIKVTQ